MTKVTLNEANQIASTYFKLLIDRHKSQGFSAHVVEKKESEKNSNFYLEFYNSQNETKRYKIATNNN
ncbi:MAG: hypothetical protein CR986_01875 [Ignavibacteriae bacterium]|nr:MAG: hypothetical protein CR986_01875 [Ignavibacteriota bacterium]